MKKLFISAMICLFAVSCSNEGEGSIESIEGNEVQYAQVSVNVSGFSASVDEFPGTRTLTRTAVGDYVDVKAIDLAFYSANGTEVYKHTQWREDATTYTTFGSFSCNLPLGSYTLVVIARGGKSTDVLTLTSPTAASYTSDYARETFAATQAVTVSNTSPLNLSPELSRIMAKLNIVSTDAKPADAAKLRTTYTEGSKSFNPTTGLATDNNGFTVEQAGAVSDGHYTAINYAFLSSNEHTMNIQLDVLDANDNILNTKLIENVPLQQNRITLLRGALFTADPSSFTFTLNTDWATGNTVDF